MSETTTDECANTKMLVMTSPGTIANTLCTLTLSEIGLVLLACRIRIDLCHDAFYREVDRRKLCKSRQNNSLGQHANGGWK